MKIDLSNAKLETERLLLRGWEKSDLADFFEYASVEGVGEQAGWKHHESMEESEKILKLFREGKNVFAIELKENQKVIGSLGLHDSWANEDENYQAMEIKEIGYVLSKSYWGKGLMPEAAAAMIDFCFEELHLDALTCGHFTENHQSQRVIEKCGFHFVKERQYEAKQLGKCFPTKEYILVKEQRG
ncbi:GNAT family N-acetyltransferase [Acidaminobacterium chupaoyuni]